jgi:endonuclease YncB( thermonuclease family)
LGIVQQQTSALTNYSGRVEIRGRIFLNKLFEGGGIADADTIKIDVGPDSVRFRESENSQWRENLKVLNDGRYYDDNHELKPVVEVHSGFSAVRIRLQGIDAAELHYGVHQGSVQLDSSQQAKFDLAKDINYRQKWGARATKELIDFLTHYQYEENGKKYVNVYAFSNVDTPSNLFDKFGRAICDVVIAEDGTNVNQWLVKKGWSFPDFYNSMSESEVKTLQQAGAQASNPPIGIRGSYSKNLVVPFDFDMIFDRNNPSIDVEQDKGGLNLPKFFRKQVDYEVLKRCGVSSFATLKDFIRFTNTRCYKTEEVLKERNSPMVYQLSDFIDENGYMDFDVGGLIYIESEAQLFDKNGNVMNEWY